ncbi:MAG: hypothetical protein IKQ52_09625 [Bacteroidales bacterium]|nr:hypothetical protein [Bacteroidales bacterium]
MDMKESANSVINAATVIAVRHEKREQIKHEEWKELKESLARFYKSLEEIEPKVGFHQR